MNGCVCPGDTLTFECTVTGGGTTIWTGSAFDCSSKNNEKLLRHSQFSHGKSTSGYCNNGAIVARSHSVEGNNYTSQFNVTVTPGIGGKTIQCAHSGEYINYLLSWTLPTAIGLSLTNFMLLLLIIIYRGTSTTQHSRNQ